MHKVVLWVQTVLVPMLGAPGMFIVAFLDSSFLSFPEINDILLVTSSHIHPERAWLYAVMTTLGSVTGCLVMWELGRRGGEVFLARKFGAGRVERVRQALQKWGVLTLAIPSILPPPMPFKIFVVAAGVFGFPWTRFTLTVLLARGARYAAWAFLGATYGDQAVGLLRSFDAWAASRSTLLLAGVAGIALATLAYLWARRRARLAPDV
jgi:membrane protein YqaA with SNARE-associated domain